MKNDFLKATIDHNRNIKDNIYTDLLLTIGGTISLILHPASLLNSAFVIIGFSTIARLISGYIAKYQLIKKDLKELNEKD